MPHLALLATMAAAAACEKAASSAESSWCTLADAQVTCVVAEGRGAPPTAAQRPESVLIPGRVRASATPDDGGYACVVANGDVYCWGRGPKGQLGDGVEADDVRGPVKVPGPIEATKVTTTGVRACALEASGRVWCWGSLHWIDPVVPHSGRHPVVVATGAADLAAGLIQTCAVISGEVHCWGAMYPREDGRQVDTYGVTRIPGITDATAVQGYEAATCATLSSGRRKCWSTTVIPLDEREQRP
jgi:alpha-tubulin suppressor-like RCC1 family protein